MTLFLSPSGYFSSCLWVSGSRSPSWCHLTGHPVYTRSSPPPWTTQALWSPFPAHYCSAGCAGLKRGPQILESQIEDPAEIIKPKDDDDVNPIIVPVEDDVKKNEKIVPPVEVKPTVVESEPTNEPNEIDVENDVKSDEIEVETEDEE